MREISTVVCASAPAPGASVQAPFLLSPDMARAIWRGRLVLGEADVPVKLYSAVADRKVHFRLLHAKDLSPVRQQLVRKTDGKAVPREEQLKAFPLDDGTAVIIRPEELEKLEPADARDINVTRFVPREALGKQWFDRPYYLGPDDDEKGYFALADAIEKRGTLGVCRWVMRDKPYLGALTAEAGYLMMITLRRADQVLVMPALNVPARSKPDAKELRLAEQLVDSIADKFEPDLWQDEYQERVRKLIQAKAAGKDIEVKEPKRKPPTGDLADTLRQSLKAA